MDLFLLMIRFLPVTFIFLAVHLLIFVFLGIRLDSRILIR